MNGKGANPESRRQEFQVTGPRQILSSGAAVAILQNRLKNPPGGPSRPPTGAGANPRR